MWWIIVKDNITLTHLSYSFLIPRTANLTIFWFQSFQCLCKWFKIFPYSYSITVFLSIISQFNITNWLNMTQLKFCISDFIPLNPIIIRSLQYQYNYLYSDPIQIISMNQKSVWWRNEIYIDMEQNTQIMKFHSPPFSIIDVPFMTNQYKILNNNIGWKKFYNSSRKHGNMTLSNFDINQNWTMSFLTHFNIFHTSCIHYQYIWH
jgi:hypothetical protein